MAGTTYSAPDIYHRIKGGKGAGPFADNSAVTGEQANVQSSLNKQIDQLNTKMNTAWQGNAADQAFSGAAPLAGSAESASASLTQASAAMSNQVGAFTTAYNSVVPMASSAPQNNVVNEFVSGFGVTTPLDNQINQYNSAGQHNVQVYNTYSTESSANAAQMPSTFDTLPSPHPTITVVGGSGSGGATYGTFTSPAGAGGYPTGTSGAPRSGLSEPVWTSPSGSSGGATARVTSGSGPGGAWETTGPSQTTTPADFFPGGGGPGGSSGFPGGEVPFGGVNGNPGNGPGDEYYPGGMPFGYNPNGGNQNEDQEYPPGYTGPGGGYNDPNGFPGGPGGGAGGFGGAGGTGPGGSSFRGGPGGFGGAGGSGGASGPGGTSSASTGGPGGLTPTGEEALAGRGMIGVPMTGAPGEGGMFPPGRGAKGEDDKEHKTAEYLQEADPDALFGSDQLTIPPVLGE